MKDTKKRKAEKKKPEKKKPSASVMFWLAVAKAVCEIFVAIKTLLG